LPSAEWPTVRAKGAVEGVVDEAERKIAELNLLEADDAIAQGREDIAKQTQLIAELSRAGYDIQGATEPLNTLHQSQTLLVEHRDQLKRELALET
jgi:hypothetical protein